jgi:hypothetical protein
MFQEHNIIFVFFSFSRSGGLEGYDVKHDLASIRINLACYNRITFRNESNLGPQHSLSKLVGL